MDRQRLTRILGRTLLWLVIIFQTLSMSLAGSAKFINREFWAPLFDAWGYGGGWFLTAVGVGEIGGALLLLIPRTAAYGASILTVIMLGALYTVTTKESGGLVPGPVIGNLVMLGIIIWFRRPRWARTQERSARS